LECEWGFNKESWVSEKRIKMGFSNFRKKHEKHIKDSVVNLSGENTGIEVIPTNLLAIDYALNGGIARGKITEIAGEFQAGKTTLALTVAGRFQKMKNAGKIKGGIYIADFEHAISPTYAAALGLDIHDQDSVMWMQPIRGADELSDDLERIYEMQKKEEVCSLLIIDSLAAMRPRSEIENTLEMADKHKGAHARMCSAFFAKHTAQFSKNKITVIVINQSRTKINIQSQYTPDRNKGVMTVNDAYNTTGGKAPKFYFFNRIILQTEKIIKEKRHDPIMNNDRKVNTYQVVQIDNIKDKKGIPFRRDRFHIRWGTGVSQIDTVIEKAKAWGFIVNEGQSWFVKDNTGNEVLKVRGQDAFDRKLRDAEDPTVIQALRVLKHLVKDRYEQLAMESNIKYEEKLQKAISMEDMMEGEGSGKKIDMDTGEDENPSKKSKSTRKPKIDMDTGDDDED